MNKDTNRIREIRDWCHEEYKTASRIAKSSALKFCFNSDDEESRQDAIVHNKVSIAWLSVYEELTSFLEPDTTATSGEREG